MPAGPAASPPEAITPTSAYWDPPENMSRLRTHVCQTSRPAATDSAPNEMPYAAVATPTAMPERVAARRGSRSATLPGAATREVDPVHAVVVAEGREDGGDREADARGLARGEDAAEQLGALAHLLDAGSGDLLRE